MGYEFTQTDEANVDATVDDVWNAIATGPGIDSWFMGTNEVADGIVRTVFGGYAPEQPITASEPGHRFAYGAPPEPDGRFIAFDFLIEGREGSSTSLRLVTAGFLPGDDWAEEFEAMKKGGALYFATLVEYLNHFARRTAMPLTASGPIVKDWPAAWEALGRTLGLPGRPNTGDAVRLTIDGATLDGTVYFANEHTVGARTPDALYRFVMGFRPGGGGPMLAMHNLFAPDVDVQREERAWSAWLETALA
jgi:uncharacterized protein YndB with AHSA1/START domain